MTARVHHHHFFNWSLIGGNENSISDMETKNRHVNWTESNIATKIICCYGQLRRSINVAIFRGSINRREKMT